MNKYFIKAVEMLMSDRTKNADFTHYEKLNILNASELLRRNLTTRHYSAA
jgi:hypothetical protein